MLDIKRMEVKLKGGYPRDRMLSIKRMCRLVAFAQQQPQAMSYTYRCLAGNYGTDKKMEATMGSRVSGR